jgi:hypothetical protein
VDATTISAVRDRLKTLLETVDGLRASDTVPDSIVTPLAMVVPGSPFDAQVTMDDCHDFSYNVVVLVTRSTGAVAVAQDALDAYAWTVRDAVDTGATADWDFCMAGNPTDYGDYTFGAGDGAQVYLGFTLPVTVGVS